MTRKQSITKKMFPRRELQRADDLDYWSFKIILQLIAENAGTGVLFHEKWKVIEY